MENYDFLKEQWAYFGNIGEDGIMIRISKVINKKIIGDSPELESATLVTRKPISECETIVILD